METQNNMLLSITVPTYNRCGFLKDFLLSVINSIVKYNLKEKVEIIISDNCSPDNTQLVVENLKNEYSDIKIIYNKNPQNLGVIPNIAQLIELAKGKYLMMYGDDDLMCADALPQLLDILVKNENTKVFLFKNRDWAKYKYNEECISLENAGEHYLWTIGNFGLFACDSYLMKKNLSLHRDRILTTCWPQTELMFLVMAESNQELPLFVSNLGITIYPNHINNTFYTAYYIYESGFYALYRVAKHIENHIKKPFVEIAMSNTGYFSASSQDIKILMYNHILYYDYENELEDLKKNVNESLSVVQETSVRKIPLMMNKILTTSKRLNQLRLGFLQVQKNSSQKIKTIKEGFLSFLAFIKDLILPYSIYQDIKRQEAKAKKFKIEKEEFLKHKRTYSRKDFNPDKT